MAAEVCPTAAPFLPADFPLNVIIVQDAQAPSRFFRYSDVAETGASLSSANPDWIAVFPACRRPASPDVCFARTPIKAFFLYRSPKRSAAKRRPHSGISRRMLRFTGQPPAVFLQPVIFRRRQRKPGAEKHFPVSYQGSQRCRRFRNQESGSHKR